MVGCLTSELTCLRSAFETNKDGSSTNRMEERLSVGVVARRDNDCGLAVYPCRGSSSSDGITCSGNPRARIIRLTFAIRFTASDQKRNGSRRFRVTSDRKIDFNFKHRLGLSKEEWRAAPSRAEPRAGVLLFRAFVYRVRCCNLQEEVVVAVAVAVS